MPANDASKMLSAGRRRPAHVAAVPSPPEEGTATRRPGDQAQASAQAYVKTSAFITPDQRSWLNEVVARAKLDGIDGISASDIVRLALSDLQATDGGERLAERLVEQAYAEAERFPGRKNRGLPQRR